jgi:hypothetical protein
LLKLTVMMPLLAGPGQLGSTETMFTLIDQASPRPTGMLRALPQTKLS